MLGLPNATGLRWQVSREFDPNLALYSKAQASEIRPVLAILNLEVGGNDFLGNYVKPVDPEDWFPATRALVGYRVRAGTKKGHGAHWIAGWKPEPKTWSLALDDVREAHETAKKFSGRVVRVVRVKDEPRQVCSDEQARLRSGARSVALRVVLDLLGPRHVSS